MAPNSEIAEAVGYQSETAFSRAYRRRFAITPSRDRKDALGGSEGEGGKTRPEHAVAN
jgi:AraC-like DNA-binding protein